MRDLKYGWKRDLPDHRDYKYVNPKIIALPPKVDWRPLCPPIYDQGDLGSCTANAIAASLEYKQIKKGVKDHFCPSRLFIYYNERLMEGTVKEDAGAMIRDGIKSVNKEGACKEKTWPYKIPKFKTKPTPTAYKEAKLHEATSYLSVAQDPYSVKVCLACGDLITFGFTVYESFESEEVAKTGIMIPPSSNEKPLGGHAVTAVGYDDEAQHVIVRNSWGESWGDKGYFYMPYSFFFSNQTDDFWAIKDIEI